MKTQGLKRLAISGQSFKELATSRRSIRRLNNAGSETLGLYDEDNQVLYVTAKSEVSKLILGEQPAQNSTSEHSRKSADC